MEYSRLLRNTEENLGIVRNIKEYFRNALQYFRNNKIFLKYSQVFHQNSFVFLKYSLSTPKKQEYSGIRMLIEK